VIIQQLEDGKVEVAAVDPVASMMAVENSNLNVIAEEIKTLLEKAIKSL
jgi:hypothetical protein